MAVHIRESSHMVTSRFAPSRYFNGLALNPKYLCPNELFVNVEKDEDDENVRHITMAYGGFKKVIIDTIDNATLEYVYSVVDGSDFDHNMTERISYEAKVDADPNGGPGSCATLKVKHYLKESGEGLNLSDEQLLEETKRQGFDVFDEAEKHLEEK